MVRPEAASAEILRRFQQERDILASLDHPNIARLARSDLMLMTPEYASPERVRGEAVTGLSDIDALGVVLYELLTGRRPYSLASRVYNEIARVICE